MIPINWLTIINHYEPWTMNHDFPFKSQAHPMPNKKGPTA